MTDISENRKLANNLWKIGFVLFVMGILLQITILQFNLRLLLFDIVGIVFFAITAEVPYPNIWAKRMLYDHSIDKKSDRKNKK